MQVLVLLVLFLLLLLLFFFLFQTLSQKVGKVCSQREPALGES